MNRENIEAILRSAARHIEVDAELRERLPRLAGLSIGAERWELAPGRVPPIEPRTGARRSACELALSESGFERLVDGANPQELLLAGELRATGDLDEILRANELCALLAIAGGERSA